MYKQHYYILSETTCFQLICFKYSFRCSIVFLSCYVCNYILIIFVSPDIIVPINEGNSSHLILGILGCLRLLLPNIGCDRSDEGISGSFGLRHKKDESLLSVDRLIQVCNVN